MDAQRRKAGSLRRPCAGDAAQQVPQGGSVTGLSPQVQWSPARQTAVALPPCSALRVLVPTGGHPQLCVPTGPSTPNLPATQAVPPPKCAPKALAHPQIAGASSPHRSSSEPSMQSGKESHCCLMRTHWPLAHRNWLGRQTAAKRVLCSERQEGTRAWPSAQATHHAWGLGAEPSTRTSPHQACPKAVRRQRRDWRERAPDTTSTPRRHLPASTLGQAARVRPPALPEAPWEGAARGTTGGASPPEG